MENLELTLPLLIYVLIHAIKKTKLIPKKYIPILSCFLGGILSPIYDGSLFTYSITSISHSVLYGIFTGGYLPFLHDTIK